MKLLERTKTAIFLVSLIIIISVAGSICAQAPVKVVGSVTDQLSVPISGARISLFSVDRILQTTSDSSGHFSFDAVLSRKYVLEVMAPGFKISNKLVAVTDLMQTRMRNKPIEMKIVMEIAPTGSAHPDQANGKISYVSCEPPEAVSYTPRMKGDADVLSGIAVDGYSKTGVSGATVQLFDRAGKQMASQQTNARGEFQFGQLAPGRYSVVFQRSGYNTMRSSREFWVAHENKTHITFQAVQLGKIVVCQ